MIILFTWVNFIFILINYKNYKDQIFIFLVEIYTKRKQRQKTNLLIVIKSIFFNHN